MALKRNVGFAKKGTAKALTENMPKYGLHEVAKFRAGAKKVKWDKIF